MATETIQRQLRTVGDLETYIAELKAAGHITAESPLAGIDVDGCTSGAKRGCTAYVFNPNERGIGDHMFAVWGNPRP
jgi:hypothetical protein